LHRYECWPTNPADSAADQQPKPVTCHLSPVSSQLALAPLRPTLRFDPDAAAFVRTPQTWLGRPAAFHRSAPLPARRLFPCQVFLRSCVIVFWRERSAASLAGMLEDRSMMAARRLTRCREVPGSRRSRAGGLAGEKKPEQLVDSRLFGSVNLLETVGCWASMQASWQRVGRPVRARGRRP
jgi:hypothetical protein